MTGGLGFEELPREECLRLIAQEPVGRVGISVSALPAVLPVNFALLGDNIVFRTAPGTKFEVATQNAVVAFEVDHYDPQARTGWSVLVCGMADQIINPAELEQAQALDLESWALDGQADRYVKIPTTVITGRRIVLDQ